MFTMKNEFGEGITTDIGGEFVDTTHTEIIQLMKEFGLSFYDLRKDELEPKELYFGRRHISNEELKNAFAPFVNRLVNDIKSLPEILSYKTAENFRHIDNQSIADIFWIGITGWLYDFINVVLTREYGMEITEQSAVNFLIMFEPPKENYYEMFGDDHEVMKIKGGSQRLTDAIYQKIKENVRLNHQFLSISPGKKTGYKLSLKNNNAIREIYADYVVLAIPFTILRSLKLNIDIPSEKQKCIDEIGYGNSCKFIMGMNSKPWRLAGKQGYTFSDISFGFAAGTAAKASLQTREASLFSAAENLVKASMKNQEKH